MSGTSLVERLRDPSEVNALIVRRQAADELERLLTIEVAARELYERVEMDESVGVCLSDRVPSLTLGAALLSKATGE